jgi:hypothetical protein
VDAVVAEPELDVVSVVVVLPGYDPGYDPG